MKVEDKVTRKGIQEIQWKNPGVLVYEKGLSSDKRNHKENFEKFHFLHKKLIFMNICANSKHQKVFIRKKPKHQKLSTRNLVMHQKLSTWNTPQPQNLSTRNKSHFVPGRELLLLRFVPGRHHLVLMFVPGTLIGAEVCSG